MDAVTYALASASQEEIVDGAAYVVDSLVRRWIVCGKYRPGLDTNTVYLEIALHAAAAIAVVSSRFMCQIKPEDVLAAMQFTSVASTECTCQQEESTSTYDSVLHPLGIPVCLAPHKCFTDRVHFSRYGRQVCTTSSSTIACPSRCIKCSWFAGLLSVIDDSVSDFQKKKMVVTGIGPSSWFRFLDSCPENYPLAMEYAKAELSMPVTDEEDSLDTARRFVLTWF